MPKRSFTLGLIRALRSAALKTAHKHATPYFEDIVGRGADMLKSVGLGALAEPAANAANAAYKHAPKVLDALADRLMEPNATIVPPDVADKASAFVGDPAGSGVGTGQMLFGNDQPTHSLQLPTEKRQPTIPVIYDVVPNDAENAFAPKRLPKPDDASVAGAMFRKVGPGTNIVLDAPGYGEIQVPPKISRGAGKVPKSQSAMNRNPKAAKKDLDINKKRIKKLQKELEQAAGERKNIKEVLVTKESAKKNKRKYVKSI